MRATRCTYKPRLGQELARLTHSGLHGYSHENPTSLSIQQQQDILDRTFEQVTKFCGRPPRGSVAPWWEVSQEGAEMLLDKGIIYGK
jgi:peptidoglycan/xylan/chitin deacetylase (PgdA/CDA1 family)